jgi:glutamine amidotransferase
MGWNEIVIKNDNYNLFEQSLAPHRFYFVHSYHMLPRYNENILTTSVYGYEFVSGVIKNNIIGVQFHPEKSHKYGMSFLSKFCKL